MLTTWQHRFGFKRKSSTSYALYCLKETIHYYTERNTNVCCSLLDATKAFDRLVHSGLFSQTSFKNSSSHLSKTDHVLVFSVTMPSKVGRISQHVVSRHGRCTARRPVTKFLSLHWWASSNLKTDQGWLLHSWALHISTAVCGRYGFTRAIPQRITDTTQGIPRLLPLVGHLS